MNLPIQEKENLTRHEVNGLRHYGTPDGAFPSVTTILSATEKPEAKARLQSWKDRTPDHGKYTKRGTLVHDVARRYFLERLLRKTDWGNGDYPAAVLMDSEGNPLSSAEAQYCLNDLESVKPFVRGMKDTLERFSDFVWVEGPVRGEDIHTVGEDGVPRLWSKKYGFAGCPDLIAEYISDGYTLTDIKTSEVPYRKFRPSASYGTEEFRKEYGGWMKFKKAAMQIAAYSIMAEEALGVEVSQGMVLVSMPGQTNTYAIDTKQLEYHKRQWLEKVELYYSSLEMLTE